MIESAMDRKPDRNVVYSPNMKEFPEFTRISNLPDLSNLKLLRHCSWGSGGPFQCLIRYGDTCYNFILTYNADESDSVVNKCLEKIHQGLANRNYTVMDDGVADSFEVILPILKSECDTCVMSGPHKNEEQVVKIMIKSEGGSVRTYRHNRELHHNFDDSRGVPIENPFPELRVVVHSEIESSEELESGLRKVKIDGKGYLHKKACDTDPDSFLREFTIQATLPPHPNVVSLFGVTNVDGGKVDGLLMPFIDGSILKEITSATAEQKIKWKEQISEAVQFLHDSDTIWGDAAVQNVMIDRVNDRAVLIDFGGGITRGWIDDDLYETKEGDLQALERLLSYIDNLDEPST